MLHLLKGAYRLFRCIREFVISLVFILFVMLGFAFMALWSSDAANSKTPVEFSKGALLLNLDGYLADNHDEFSDFNRFLRSELGGTNEPIKISTFDVVRAIKKAQYDEKITGLVLDLSYFEGGDIPSLTYVGKEIERFKQSNKPVIAIGEGYSQQQYYLASYADKIYLNKAGFVDLHGLNYSTLYFKSLLDKIEAVPHIFRVGTYKSAVEPFLRDDMSAEARQNAQLWLSQLWANFSNAIAKNRQIDANTIVPEANRLIAQYKAVKGDDAQYALTQKWVTNVATHRQIRLDLIEQFGEDQDGNYNHIDFFDYSLSLSDRFNVVGKDKIAIVNVEGAIVLGESDDEVAGSDTIVKLLRKAREDDDVRGVVLRINSPGGSAMASELIRQEVEDLQQAGKPVVASMGGMAASGGYWIAATSDKIIASPTTLTGSIGIFALAVSFEKTAKKLGVNEDGVSTSPFAQQTALKPLSKEQSELIQISIENGYDRFLELVSKGRKMSKGDVDKVAQGQVWLGESAFEKGLVDELGDFDDAYHALTILINEKRKAKGETEIERFSTQWLIDESDDLISQVMRDFKLQLQLKAVEWLNLPLPQQTQQQLGMLAKFNDPKQSYLYCLNCGSVK
ncbi:signal peptide peptidase SppA [Glaesserella parasuis]|uniref:signal peptide peptidase SppA n=1 Tax=Glaesserella parasuis TaxID=738 RepID=UPI0024366AF7|nr:signal peptide peptidase SppA [Glaesserella parasuis]MDG6305480.1 signal peptide peptidase SppA [Glaesserella parasuis]